MVSMSNNYFLFLSPNSIFFLQWKCGTSPLETGGFSTMAISWFLGALDQEKTWFLHEETTSRIFCYLSSLITLPCQRFAYVASYLMRIETIINVPLELPLASTSFVSRDYNQDTSKLQVMNGFTLLNFKLNFTVASQWTSIKITLIVLFWFLEEKPVNFFRLCDIKWSSEKMLAWIA